MTDWLTKTLTNTDLLRERAAAVRADKGVARFHAANALEAAALRIEALEAENRRLNAAAELAPEPAHEELIRDTLVLPTGMRLEDEDAADEVRHFALSVEWRGTRTETGRGGWAVKNGGDELSRAGKWAWPRKFQQHQYRWETREEALAMAHKYVDTVTVRGRTWAQWQAHFAEQAATERTTA